MHKLVIIGAGISGSMAAGYFSSLSPIVFDASPKHNPLDNHKAVMRIRDHQIGLILGCPMEEVKVRKAVLFDGELHDNASITMANMYSLKTNGTISERSIGELGVAKRYMIHDVPSIKGDVCFDHELYYVEPGKLYFRDFSLREPTHHPERIIEYDYCISTIPMNKLIEATGMSKKYNLDFTGRPIHICKAELTIQSNVHQTIYIPEDKYVSYRATLQGNVMIIEAVKEIEFDEVYSIADYFGVSSEKIANMNFNKQNLGKIIPIDDDIRRAIILQLTTEFNIYSVGRFALWKQVLVDDVVKDLGVVSKMMAASRTEARYNLSK